ncbi:MAG: glycoside hydrolase family 15 [Actinobacteria bacterium]|nr:glycoside hydrolase family 15 [Actinomycetota bacterium]
MNDLSSVLAASVAVILDNQSTSGSYVACPDFPPYRYSWFRDGAFIAEAMSRSGQTGSADRFHGWCSDVVGQRRDRIDRLIARASDGEPIEASEHLHTRYTLDGREADEEWWTFQLDGYGTWLWALDTHLRRHGGSRLPYLSSVAATIEYLAAFHDHPCYDWWEENVDQRHTSTLVAVAAGLRAVSSWPDLDGSRLAAATADRILERVAVEGVHDGHLTKWLGSTEVDASLIAAFVPFGLYPVDGELARATIGRIERELVPAGVHRYGDDVYYGGGEWVLLAGFLGSYHAAAGNDLRARELLGWIAAQADGDGHLPEQVNTHMLHPEDEQRWIEHWGPSAKPLLWSHAMLLSLAADLDLEGHARSTQPELV